MKNNRGAVLVEAVLGASLTILIVVFFFSYFFHVWSKAFVSLEAFYIARARLYNAPNDCSPNLALVSEQLIPRAYQCSGNRVTVNYGFYGNRNLTPVKIFIQLSRN